ncbi:MAG: tRNA (adenosine(37)-N6)-dimethylallyltransferase MiaA [Acidobacteria bacterium]|nr:tRNA (adenosine(37)-N6)-dimethylallyltransferase MiaA [Acidobacteriota bacterium]
MTQNYPLLVIVGPTAAGKSALAMALALRWNGEVINCDSVQVYRGFDIGTGKVSPPARQGIPHHLLDIVEPSQTFNAGDYRREAIRALYEVRERGRLPIVVGGTGLYLRALLLGLFEGPERSEGVRERLSQMAKRHSREFLHRMLVRMDRKAAGRIHPRDTPKIIRALEVCLLARQPITDMHERGRSALEGFHVLKVGLNPHRAQLAERIALRTEEMFRSGLVGEVRDMLKRRDAERIKPLGAIGYREARAVLAGELTEAEAIRRVQTATRQYAKRQMTWFRREKDVEWFEGFGDDATIDRRISDWLAGRLQDTNRKPRR